MTVIDQPMSALAKANHIRSARSKLLSRLHGMDPQAGCLCAADMILDPPDVLGSMEVFDFVVKIRKVGDPSARKILGAVGVSEVKRLRELTPSQRAGVASVLRYRAAFWGVRVERAA